LCGFVDEKHGDAGEAADGGLFAREADEARAVGEQQGDVVIAVAAHLESELADEGCGFADELAALTITGADDDGERLFFGHEDVKRFERADGGLSPLAGAVEDDRGRVAAQEFGLARVGVEAEFVREPDRVESGAG